MLRTTFFALTAIVGGSMVHAASQPLIFSATGQEAADIQSTVDDFRDALGILNAPLPQAGDPNGRRQIDWDAAPDFVSDPNDFPRDFFNANVAPRARGIEFSAIDTPDGPSVDGFKLSSTQSTGQPVEFGLDEEFTFFSAERLFAPIGGTEFLATFFLPADPSQPGVSRGLGIVFTENDQDAIGPIQSNAGFSLYGIDGEDLGFFSAEKSPDAVLSFLGVIFDEPLINTAHIYAGTLSVDQAGQGIEGDFVAMDDFIFGEPVSAPVAPVPLPAGGLLLSGALAALFARRKFVAAK